jgi:plasmid stability protein
MANLQVKNFPEPLHSRLREYAHRHHQTISDVALAALEHEMARCEWHEGLARRPGAYLGISAASLLEEERGQRQRDLE